MTTIRNSSIVGEVFHVLEPFTLASGFNSTSASRIVKRGETITITQKHVDASRDRNGRSWLEEAMAPGAVSTRIAPGPWPSGKAPWRVGDRNWADAREQARLEAWAQPTEELQHEALREVHRKFGPSAPTNQTIRTQAI